MYQYLHVEERLYSPYLGRYRSFDLAAFFNLAAGAGARGVTFGISADEAFAERLAGRRTDTQLGPIHLKGAAQDCIGR